MIFMVEIFQLIPTLLQQISMFAWHAFSNDKLLSWKDNESLFSKS